ncbi:MAG: bifunctional DedA family/phosphatase PAP2 family protein [Parcubacteria group bacterium]
MHIIDAILKIPFPLLHHWAYWIVLAAAVLETAPVLGLFIPGQFIVIIGGFFASLGAIDIGDTIWIAALGAIAGDLIGYFLGKKYGYSFIEKCGRYFSFGKEKIAAGLEKTKKMVGEHAGKTLIIGRFNSLTRAFTPFVAGAMDVPFAKFLIYNIIGGSVWAAVFVMIGYIFGNSYGVASKYVGRFIVVGFILIVAFIFIYRFIDKRRHIFSKYYFKTLIFNLCSIYVFSKMLEDFFDKELMYRIDVWINAHIVSLWQPLLNKTMIIITNIGGPEVLLVLSLITCAILFYKKRIENALLLLLGMAGGAGLETLIKHFVERARPLNLLIQESGFSLPSGHAALALVFFAFLIFAFKDEIKNKFLKCVFVAACLLAALLIGFSRVYLNVHWASDVIAGFSLGLFWITFLIIIFKIVLSFRKKS